MQESPCILPQNAHSFPDKNDSRATQELTVRQKRALRCALAICIARGELIEAGNGIDAELQAERAVSSQITRLWYNCMRTKACPLGSVRVGTEPSFRARGSNTSVEVLCFAARSTVTLDSVLPAVNNAVDAMDSQGWDGTAQSYTLCSCLCAHALALHTHTCCSHGSGVDVREAVVQERERRFGLQRIEIIVQQVLARRDKQLPSSIGATTADTSAIRNTSVNVNTSPQATASAATSGVVRAVASSIGTTPGQHHTMIHLQGFAQPAYGVRPALCVGVVAALCAELKQCCVALVSLVSDSHSIGNLQDTQHDKKAGSSREGESENAARAGNGVMHNADANVSGTTNQHAKNTTNSMALWKRVECGSWVSELLTKVVLLAARGRYCLPKADEEEGAQQKHAQNSDQAMSEPSLLRMWSLIEQSIVELLHDGALEQQPLFKAAICDLIRRIRQCTCISQTAQ